MLHFCLFCENLMVTNKDQSCCCCCCFFTASNWLQLCFVESCYFNAWICPQAAAHILQAPVSAGFFPMGPLGLKCVSILRLSALFTHRERLIQANLIKLKEKPVGGAVELCCQLMILQIHSSKPFNNCVSKLKYVNITILRFCVHAAFFIALDDIQWWDENCSRDRKRPWHTLQAKTGPHMMLHGL